jgi:hypothetical protein
MPQDILEVAFSVARAFDQVGAPYFLGGSLASSLHGEPRSTNDIDFVADLRASQVARLAAALGADFSVDEDSLAEAVRRRASWNIYYLPLVTKIDLFVLGAGPFDQSEFSRRREIGVGAGGAALFVKSPEDTILRKLLWFVAGGEVSSTQWRDILGVLRVGAGSLDDAYLDEWASKLGVAAWLARARNESR